MGAGRSAVSDGVAGARPRAAAGAVGSPNADKSFDGTNRWETAADVDIEVKSDTEQVVIHFSASVSGGSATAVDVGLRRGTTTLRQEDDIGRTGSSKDHVSFMAIDQPGVGMWNYNLRLRGNTSGDFRNAVVHAFTLGN